MEETPQPTCWAALQGVLSVLYAGGLTQSLTQLRYSYYLGHVHDEGLSVPHRCLRSMVIVITALSVLGTLLGTMFGIASAAVLTPLNGEEGTIGIPAAPGVVIGSSLGVLAAQASGDESQTARQLLFKLVLSLGAGAAATLACGRLLGGNLLREEGIIGVVMLATVASLGSTTVLLLNRLKGLRRGRIDEPDDRGYLPRMEKEGEAEMGPKYV